MIESGADLERMYAQRAHSHAVYLSHPKGVAALIDDDARSVLSA